MAKAEDLLEGFKPRTAEEKLAGFGDSKADDLLADYRPTNKSELRKRVDRLKQDAGEFLPSTLKIWNPETMWNPDARHFDTGWELDSKGEKKFAAALVGAGHMMIDAKRGIEQMLTEDETRLAEMQVEENIMNQLYSDKELGQSAVAGAIAGALAEPVGTAAALLNPALKLNSLRKAVTVGAITGGTFGAIGYVDEEGGQTRLTNALIGAAAGGVLAPALVGVAKAHSAWTNKVLTTTSQNIVDTFEHVVANNRVTHGMGRVESVKGAYEQLQITSDELADHIIKAGHTKKSLQDLTNLDQSNLVLKNWEDKISARAQSRWTPKPVEDWVTPLTSVLERIDPFLKKSVKQADAEQHIIQGRWLEQTHDLREALRKLSNKDETAGMQLNKHLMSGDFDEARAVMRDKGISEELFQTALDVYKEAYTAMRTVGYKIPKMDNYWHRAVKDPELISKTQNAALKQAISAAEKRHKGTLSPAQMTKVIQNTILKAQKDRFRTGGQLRKRSVELEDRLMPAYYRPEQALEYYIMQVSDDVSRARMFKSLGHHKKMKLDGSDAEKIIEDLALKQWAKNPADARKLRDALRARYVQGVTPSSQAIRDFKNVAYASLLGNPFAAAIQLGDAVFSVHKFGVMDTVRTMIGKKPVKREMLGIQDASMELQDVISPTKKLADWAMRWGGFQRMDKFGKETFINTAYRNNSRLAKNNPGKFKEKWEDVYGTETDQLIDDLANDRISDNVKMMLFNELSEVQPIALSEMPLKYLQHPNGRVVYMMRSFTIKQLDYMRKQIQGIEDPYTKAKNLTKFALLFAGLNGSIHHFRDWMKGNEPAPEETVVDTLAMMVGLSRYDMSSVMREGPGQTAVNFIAPPVTLLDKTFTRADTPAEAMQEVFYRVPLVGPITETAVKWGQ